MAELIALGMVRMVKMLYNNGQSAAKFQTGGRTFDRGRWNAVHRLNGGGVLLSLAS